MNALRERPWARQAAAALACGTLPRVAGAHGTTLDWHVAPSTSLQVLLPLLAVSLLYAAGLVRREASSGLTTGDSRRATAFFSAVVLLVFALVWPLDAWSGLSFAAHMGQHMVLLALVPPLLMVARPGSGLLRGLPRSWRPVATWPRRWGWVAACRRASASVGATGSLHAAVLWLWHVPAAFELAQRHDLVHWFEHVSLLASGMLYWRSLFRARGGALGWALASMLATLLHTGVLGALLTLSPRPLYRSYELQSGAVQALSDQQLAGLIMWVPMGTVYLIAALAFAARLVGPSAAAGTPGSHAARGSPLS